jgi:hypothetical protein
MAREALQLVSRADITEPIPQPQAAPKLRLVPSSAHGGKAKFAIDIDSILYDFSTPAREAFLKLSETTGDRSLLRGTYVSWVEWRTPADVCGLEMWMEVISMCHAPEVILRQKPFAGAVDTLQALVGQGYDLMYCSNRNEEAADATRQWLQQEGFPLGDHVEVRCTMEDKVTYLAECQYIIDDRPKTLIDFIHSPNWDQAKGERKGLSIMYEYNRALTDIPNIFLSPTWAGLAGWLVRKNFLPTPPHTALETHAG